MARANGEPSGVASKQEQRSTSRGAEEQRSRGARRVCTEYCSRSSRRRADAGSGWLARKERSSGCSWLVNNGQWSVVTGVVKVKSFKCARWVHRVWFGKALLQFLPPAASGSAGFVDSSLCNNTGSDSSCEQSRSRPVVCRWEKSR